VKLDAAMASVQAGDDRAVGGAERREQAGRTVPDVVVGAFSGMPGIIGNAGWERARACACDCPSTDNTTATAGGLK
jgi:hypothetical protein